jgi:Regulator of G protein signaling domain
MRPLEPGVRLHPPAPAIPESTPHPPTEQQKQRTNRTGPQPHRRTTLANDVLEIYTSPLRRSGHRLNDLDMIDASVASTNGSSARGRPRRALFELDETRISEVAWWEHMARLGGGMGLRDWKASTDVSQVKLATLRGEGAIPSNLEACRQDPIWRDILYLHLADEAATENLAFLDEVDELRARDFDLVLADEIYQRFLAEGASERLNVGGHTYQLAREAFADQPTRAPVIQVLDTAYQEVRGPLTLDTYPRFLARVEGIRTELRRDEGTRIEFQADADVRRADPATRAPGPKDLEVIDGWNERALKRLGEGQEVYFYEVGDIVIIDAQEARTIQPFLGWAKQQAGLAGTVIMVAKGGAFSPGRIRAVGVKDRYAFSSAIGRVSKKQIQY